jgi:hypothetical protein
MLARMVSSMKEVCVGATDSNSADGRQGADIPDHG